MTLLRCDQNRCRVPYTSDVRDVTEIRCVHSSFPEWGYPPSSPDYCDFVRLGYQRSRHVHVSILALMRNLGDRFPRSVQLIEEIAALFRSYTVNIYENDSNDGTGRRLREKCDSNPNWFCLCETLNKQKWGQVRSGVRGEHMAHYRNRCKQLALNHPTTPDLFIVLDSDLHGFSCDGLYHTLGHWDHFDAMFSNGLDYRPQPIQFDAWAFREAMWEPVASRAVSHRVFQRGAPLVPVLSAFGGLGVYTYPAYYAGQYKGGDCEHVPFHQSLHAAGFTRKFVNPSQITLYRPRLTSQ